MGLRLVTPDGRRITRLSRWVLRCTACFLVTKEMGRLFCPRCGNASLDKVQLVVGPDGAEQYGVRRKHILRGTRFSLPKPKVKRAAGNKTSEHLQIARGCSGLLAFCYHPPTVSFDLGGAHDASWR